jgi:starch synthase (maltosyl-transferring)
MQNVSLRQDPVPDQRLLMSRGDTVTFTLWLSRPLKGQAWLRSNIGHATTIRKEIIRQAEHAETPLAQDWFDRPMRPAGTAEFRIVVPLQQVGHFEAKCYFLETGSQTPLWPQGQNTVINVEPAENCAANIIYNAFVRQFGPNKDGRVGHEWACEAVAELDRKHFTVIPPSGTFRDLIGHLDFIVGELGCTVIQLLPIHPTPTTYARMGRFGSPYAALSFLDVDPALAQFDPAATPMEQFGELVDGVHARGARLMLDIAINHTGWAARMHAMHPEWLARDDGGRIEVPGAWGVQWEDLTRLDYTHRSLWRFMADMFLTWCRRGVDGFRCDAGYMIPQPAWRYMVAKVRREFPDTVFLLEGLGGKMVVTRDLLNRANFNWAYSELFQNYDRRQIEAYLPEALDIAAADGLTVNFAETHDNPRLAARSHLWARMRTALCALSAPQGAFGFANGVEWLATDKINVHDAPSLNWGAVPNQVAFIRRLTDLLKHHPCFHDRTRLRLIQADGGNVVVLLRHHGPTDERLLVVVNLDDQSAATASWPSEAAGMRSTAFKDLLSDRTVNGEIRGGYVRCALAPGEALCLAPSTTRFMLPDPDSGAPRAAVPRVEHQRRRAKVLDLLAYWNGDRCDGLDIDGLARELAADPAALCRRLHPDGNTPGIVFWRWPHDRRRQVMIPAGHVLLVDAPHPFQARIVMNRRVVGKETSLTGRDGRHFTLFTPAPAPAVTARAELALFLYKPEATERSLAELLLLGAPEAARIRALWRRQGLLDSRQVWLGTNGRGAMIHTPVRWGVLYSRYDALLAANLDPEVPEDRWIMLTRLRAWVVYQGYSQEICHDCLESFHYDGQNRARWHFRIPTGQGQSVRLTISMGMPKAANTVAILFRREPAGQVPDGLPDLQPVRLIVRPDIEDRNFHATTKAYLGPETQFPAALTPEPAGFRFLPDPGRRLRVTASRGDYVHEPEWTYMVHRPLEAERGLDAASDLFSPGYFAADLAGGAQMVMKAAANAAGDADATSGSDAPWSGVRERYRAPETALRQAIAQFVVKRGPFATVIAGYPWFLDWGRDTLIFCRGMIAAGMTETAVDIIRQFAAFEHKGTLPNMIRGNDATNRDTSDAPLWLFVACQDLIRSGHPEILDLRCGPRRMRDVLTDMASALCRGTPNGIVMDAQSALLYSPAHFTWMDTNHPAGTPREGYPIEIQALWFAALNLLSEIGDTARRADWHRLANQVRTSIDDLFFDPALGYLADCLHGPPGQPAAACQADDALRPNQLFAITLGAVNDPTRARSIVEACEALIVPGAIRSLADRSVARPLAVHHQGRLLNDPQHPYQGHYRGDEDTQRKPAYHNGTAWTWVFPSFCEARASVYGEGGRPSSRALLATALDHMNGGCLGHIPEILDGDSPHTPRGCDAQAWSVSEVYRVWQLLTRSGEFHTATSSAEPPVGRHE